MRLGIIQLSQQTRNYRLTDSKLLNDRWGTLVFMRENGSLGCCYTKNPLNANHLRNIDQDGRGALVNTKPYGIADQSNVGKYGTPDFTIYDLGSLAAIVLVVSFIWKNWPLKRPQRCIYLFGLRFTNSFDRIIAIE
jgi:hypothetical protein